MCALLTFSSISFAQATGGADPVPGRGQGRGQGNNQNRTQSVSIPARVLRELGFPITKEKFDALEENAKLFQSVNLPMDALLELKLTADQKKSLTQLGETNQSKMRELSRNEDREGATALREQLASKVDAILTSEQKMVVAKYPSRQGGGRRGKG